MGWGFDREKFQRHTQEAQRFLEQARGDQPAGFEDLIGRPFQPPEGPPVSYPSVPSVMRPSSPGDERADLVYRLQQLGQLFEAGVLSPSEFQAAKARVLSGC